MKNCVQQYGRTLTLVAPYAVASGAGAKVGGIIGVANDAYASGATGEFDVVGVFDVAKAAVAIAQGDIAYWDDTAKLFTNVATSNTKCGAFVQANLSGDATGRVRLSGQS